MPYRLKSRHDFAKRALWRILHVLTIIFAIFLTLILTKAFASRSMPPLDTWHHTPPADEFVASLLSDDFDFEKYLQLEESLFSKLDEYLIDPDNLQNRSPFLRYIRGGLQNPAQQKTNWNRTVQLVPQGTPKGGILLIHGLSDSPYSMRSLAELFYDQGYYVLAMRMPGHGAAPAGLLNATWQDWAAAVQIGVSQVKSQIDPAAPFYMGGYSNGGALAVDYTLNAITTNQPIPDQLFLFSPAIQISSLARIARWDAMYGFIPYFEKSKWLDIESEYDPYKFNSFPKNAGTQSWRLSKQIQAQLQSLQNLNRLNDIPPILTFQSIVDATVKVEGLIKILYQKLHNNGSEVVFFDINHTSILDGFVSLDFSDHLENLIQRNDLNYTVTRLTNHNQQSAQIDAQSRLPNTSSITSKPLNLHWPKGVFSLSHVAIPFPPEDSLYGEAPAAPAEFGLHIGALEPRGERHILTIPSSQLIRIRHNPFYPYMANRITQVIKANTSSSPTSQPLLRDSRSADTRNQ